MECSNPCHEECAFTAVCSCTGAVLTVAFILLDQVYQSRFFTYLGTRVCHLANAQPDSFTILTAQHVLWAYSRSRHVHAEVLGKMAGLLKEYLE